MTAHYPPSSRAALRTSWIVETLARNGDVLYRQRVPRLPVTIGRAYDNDIILSDDYCAGHHAVVDALDDGTPILRDLGSYNGTVHRRRRVRELPLGPDTVVRIGHTSLRIRPALHPVGPELRDRTMHGWEGALPGAVGLLLAVATVMLVAWLLDSSALSLQRYAQALALALGSALGWSGMWALGNQLFGTRARLGRHLFIFGCALATLFAVRAASSVLAYAFSLEWLVRYGSHAAVVVGAGMIYFHLATVTPQLRRRLRVACVALAALASTLVLAGNEQRHGDIADSLYMQVLLGPQWRASPDMPVATFIDQAATLQRAVDAERGPAPE